MSAAASKGSGSSKGGWGLGTVVLDAIGHGGGGRARGGHADMLKSEGPPATGASGEGRRGIEYVAWLVLCARG